MADTLKRIKIILAILLGLSIAVLGELDTGSKATQFRTMPVILCTSAPTANLFHNVPVTALSKTIITSDSVKETEISIYKNHTEDSEAFKCENMFPGDSETTAYLVEVSHKGTVTVRYHANIRAGYEKLAEVLKCKVVLRGQEIPLYDGLMCDMPESLNHHISSIVNKTTELTYDITVYLDASVGNEYMDKELVADFRWWVEESGSDPTPSPPGTGETTDPDINDGDLVYPPQTGDNSHFCIWFWIAMLSLLATILLLWPKQRKKDSKKEEVNANEQ